MKLPVLLMALVLSSPSWAADAAKAPHLHVTWNCGDCKPNDKVPPLIEAAYREAALKAGRALEEDEGPEVVELAIVNFRQRPPAARVLLGGFAGKDRLGVKVRYKGKELAVSDAAMNIAQGMNSLCESVGKQAFQALRSL